MWGDLFLIAPDGRTTYYRFRFVRSERRCEMKRPKFVYIAHPISGDVPGNIEKIRIIYERILREGNIPVVPYIPALLCFSDEIPEERECGIRVSLEYFRQKKVDELRLYGHRGITSGMGREIKAAWEANIPVLPQTESTR